MVSFSTVSYLKLILKGGPGCSGLLGFFSEQGPFRPNEDMTLSMNPFAWNKVKKLIKLLFVVMILVIGC